LYSAQFSGPPIRRLIAPPQSEGHLHVLGDRNEFGFDTGLLNEQNWNALGVGAEMIQYGYGPGQIHTTESPLTRNLRKFVKRVFYIPAGRNPSYASDPRDWDFNQER